jgi:hypothetical protein
MYPAHRTGTDDIVSLPVLSLPDRETPGKKCVSTFNFRHELPWYKLYELPTLFQRRRIKAKIYYYEYRDRENIDCRAAGIWLVAI